MKIGLRGGFGAGGLLVRTQAWISGLKLFELFDEIAEDPAPKLAEDVYDAGEI